MNNLQKKQLEEIDLIIFKQFLLNNKWRIHSRIKNIVSIFHSDEYIDQEIVIPENKNIKGYFDLMSSAVGKLQDSYGKNFEKIINAINGITEDLVKISVSHDDIKNGTIFLDDGVRLVNGARELMLSAVNSTIQKKRLYIGKMIEEASDYVEHLRLGQTEVGSYIVNVYSEIRKPKPAVLFEDMSFDRRVTEQVVTSISKISEVIDEFKKKDRIEIFDEAVEDGVSANLCKAIIDLSGEAKRNIGISIVINNNVGMEDNVFYRGIESNDIPFVSMGYDYLINKNELYGIEISGFVFRLSRDEDEEEGVINIATIIDDKPRKVRIYLHQKDYEKAIAAHKEQKSVTIKGDLFIESRKAKMINVKSIVILE